MAREKEKTTTVELIKMVKETEIVSVHPTQVAHWKTQGWVEAE